MSSKNEPRRGNRTEAEIDEEVARMADDPDSWESPIEVRFAPPGAIAIPSDLAGRAAFFSRLHHAQGLEEWLIRVIRERVEIEESAFAQALRQFASGRSV